MVQKVHRFGNSLAVVIPVSENTIHDLKPGAMVEVTETPSGWQVRPVDVVPRLSAELQKIADDLADKRSAVFDALAE